MGLDVLGNSSSKFIEACRQPSECQLSQEHVRITILTPKKPPESIL